MNQMEIFKNPEFGSIRVIEENGKYLFSATDGIRCDITEPGTATCSGAAHRKVKSLSTPLHPWLRPSQHKRILLRNSR